MACCVFAAMVISNFIAIINWFLNIFRTNKLGNEKGVRLGYANGKRKFFRRKSSRVIFVSIILLEVTFIAVAYGSYNYTSKDLFDHLFALPSVLYDSYISNDNRKNITIEKYVIPSVEMINQDGIPLDFKRLIESDKPVIVTFIDRSCSTICPLLSSTIASVQRQLGPDYKKIKIVSITVDPENDTPQILKDHLSSYGAKPGWDFLTGSSKDVKQVLSAFKIDSDKKMPVEPLIFIRSPRDRKWTRMIGVLNSRVILDECIKIEV